jgi:TolB protein
LNGNTELWLMNADGSGRRQLTENPGADYQPAVSPDGRYLLFASSRNDSQSNIWRMELQNGTLQQLTFGKDDENPTVTPDGQWVLYTTRGEGHWTMWKVPLTGGTAQQLTQLATQKPMVSPDGKLIAGYFYDEEKHSYRLAILPITGGKAIRFYDAPIADLLPIYWTPDGRALTYVDTREGVSNLWRQPIDGSAPQPITTFTSGRIFRYAWSRDGKTLVCERGTSLNDLVLMRPSR